MLLFICLHLKWHNCLCHFLWFYMCHKMWVWFCFQSLCCVWLGVSRNNQLTNLNWLGLWSGFLTTYLYHYIIYKNHFSYQAFTPLPAMNLRGSFIWKINKGTGKTVRNTFIYLFCCYLKPFHKPPSLNIIFCLKGVQICNKRACSLLFGFNHTVHMFYSYLLFESYNFTILKWFCK